MQADNSDERRRGDHVKDILIFLKYFEQYFEIFAKKILFLEFRRII